MVIENRLCYLCCLCIELHIRSVMNVTFCMFVGRDIHSDQHGGTWLGVSREGKFSTVTNVRTQYGQPTPAPKSRGIHRVRLTVILETNVLSKERELCAENCTRTHKKAQVCNYVLLLQ